MSCHTPFKIRFNVALVSVTSFQILLLQLCINFFSFNSRDSSVGIPVGARVFFFCKFRPGPWAHPASYSMDSGVKQSGCEVYHSSPLSAEVMNEWSCSSTAPIMPSWRGQGPRIQPPHHSALQPPQSASPTHHSSFVYRDNNGGHF